MVPIYKGENANANLARNITIILVVNVVVEDVEAKIIITVTDNNSLK